MMLAFCSAHGACMNGSNVCSPPATSVKPDANGTLWFNLSPLRGLVSRSDLLAVSSSRLCNMWMAVDRTPLCCHAAVATLRQFREGEQNQLAEAKSTLANMAALGQRRKTSVKMEASCRTSKRLVGMMSIPRENSRLSYVG